MESLIRFENVTLGYGSNIVLKDISFVIDNGDYFGLVGPNGAGKTTLLRAILGTLKPLRGTVRVGQSGEPVLFGYVPQRDTIDSVLPYTVEEVVTMGRYRHLKPFSLPSRKDKEIVCESLRHVGIDDLMHLAFKELSGGQKQRTLIARALASEPAVLILDEPTNGMDLPSKHSILELIHQLHEEDNLTVIMVSHLLDDVANYVKRIALVERKFFQVGDVDEILTDSNLTALYEMPVMVMNVPGGKIILADGKPDPGGDDGNN